MTRRHGAGRCGLLPRTGRRASTVLAVAPVLTAVLLASGCGDHGGDAPTSVVAPHAGHYAIATPAPQVTATPSVKDGGYQLVAAGEPVDVQLSGAHLVAQVSGPDVDLPTPAPGQPVTAASAPGVLTVSLTATSGSLDVSAAQFLGLDEHQHPIGLRPDADRLTVSPGHPATLHLFAQFDSGHTTLTWQPLGEPLITWDFTVEID